MDLLKAFLELIAQFFKDKEIVKKEEPKPIEPKPVENKLFRNKAILLMAASQRGVKEIPGSGDNPQIVEYQKYSTVKNLFGWADSVPWCATFVCWCLEKSGMTSTNSATARSYEHWGVSTKDNPLPGDIIIFWRESLSSGKGHVGFFLKKVGNSVYVLGGNQSDSVNVSMYTLDRMRDIRRSSLAGIYSEEQKQELIKIAEQILSGAKIDMSGKVA